MTFLYLIFCNVVLLLLICLSFGKQDFLKARIVLSLNIMHSANCSVSKCRMELYKSSVLNLNEIVNVFISILTKPTYFISISKSPFQLILFKEKRFDVTRGVCYPHDSRSADVFSFKCFVKNTLNTCLIQHVNHEFKHEMLKP